MPLYKAPLKDIGFLLHDVFAYEKEVLSLPGYAEATRDVVDAVLEEAAKFCENELQPLNLPPLRDALDFVHRPPPDADTELLATGRHPMQRRLAFEELLAHQLSLRLLRREIQRDPGWAFTAGDAQSLARKPLIILQRESVMGGGCNQIQTLARMKTVRGTLEAAHKESFEQGRIASDIRSQLGDARSHGPIVWIKKRSIPGSEER